jgi:hypothetical protein
MPDLRPPPEIAAEPDYRTKMAEVVRIYNETHNVPVAFYGQVLDQDSNAPQNVTIDLEILEQYV